MLWAVLPGLGSSSSDAPSLARSTLQQVVQQRRSQWLWARHGCLPAKLSSSLTGNRGHTRPEICPHADAVMSSSCCLNDGCLADRALRTYLGGSIPRARYVGLVELPRPLLLHAQSEKGLVRGCLWHFNPGHLKGRAPNQKLPISLSAMPSYICNHSGPLRDIAGSA